MVTTTTHAVLTVSARRGGLHRGRLLRRRCAQSHEYYSDKIHTVCTVGELLRVEHVPVSNSSVELPHTNEVSPWCGTTRLKFH